MNENEDIIETIKDQRGNDVPAELIKSIDLNRHNLVEKYSDRLHKLQQEMLEVKKELFNDVRAHLKSINKEYKIKDTGDISGAISLKNYSATKELKITYRDLVQPDERISKAKKLIDECITTWTQDGSVNENIIYIVREAFNFDKKGKISISMLLKLAQVNIKDPKWIKAIKIIRDSLQVSSSKQYVNYKERPDNSKTWETIDLNFNTI